MSDSLQPQGLQHARVPCPPLSPGVCSNLCPLSLWCHPTISSSVVPFSSCLQSFPASGSFPVSQLFASGGPSIGALASASVLPMSIRGYFLFLLGHWLCLAVFCGTCGCCMFPSTATTTIRLIYPHVAVCGGMWGGVWVLGFLCDKLGNW